MKQPEFTNLLKVAEYFPTEESCHNFLINKRWGDKPVCPHCGSSRKVYIMQGGKILKCADCRKQFTVRIGTIFQDSPIPLQKWFFALFIVSAHKKGISSIQLGKDISVTQKSAWFMLHRIRYAMGHGEFMKSLNGIVECDETYIGGKNFHGKRGRGSENKTPVFGMLDRDDSIIRSGPVSKVDGQTLKAIIKENVSPETRIMTDEWGAYNGLDKDFKSHERVDHGNEEYARGDIHVNTIEGFWSLLKRGIVGIYHHVSADHLHRYCNEFNYRYNTRKVRDTQRFEKMLTHLNGRLMYKNLIA
jgi:transposase-like protein